MLHFSFLLFRFVLGEVGWGGAQSRIEGFHCSKKIWLCKQNCELPFTLRPQHFKTEALQNITQFFIIKWENLICYIVTLLVREMLQWWRKSMLDQPKSSFYNIHLQRNNVQHSPTQHSWFSSYWSPPKKSSSNGVVHYINYSSSFLQFTPNCMRDVSH